jgi:hypothetical protein
MCKLQLKGSAISWCCERWRANRHRLPTRELIPKRRVGFSTNLPFDFFCSFKILNRIVETAQTWV